MWWSRWGRGTALYASLCVHLVQRVVSPGCYGDVHVELRQSARQLSVVKVPRYHEGCLRVFALELTDVVV